MSLAVRPAIPAASPAVPPLPFKVTSSYARLLASHPRAKGMESEGGCAMHNMVLFMRELVRQDTPHTGTYRSLLELFEFAAEARALLAQAENLRIMALPFVLLLPISHAVTKQLAKRALQQLQDKGTVLLPCLSSQHAMYLQIDREGEDTYTLRIYNTGEGLFGDGPEPNHVYGGRGKWQTMYVVRDVHAGRGPGRLNLKQLLWMLHIPLIRDGGTRSVAQIYTWANGLGRPYNPPEYALQAKQKSGSCTHKSILAVARNRLGDSAYCELLARLRERAYASYMGREHKADKQPLIDLFAQRVVSARAKAEGAQLRASLRAQHAADPWMVESIDRPAMNRALLQARDRHGKAFMLSYRNDIHQLTLATADHTGVHQGSLRPQNGMLTTQGVRYQNLEAAADYWRSYGYVQVGRAEVNAAQ